MKNFLAGLAAGVGGFFVWMTASVYFGITTWDMDTVSPMFYWIATPAYIVMVCGPLWFWLIAPVVSWIKRRRGTK